MEGTMAVVTCFAADFAPKNWASCNGQTLAIAQNQALFALLGTTYGGNGVTTFSLPNMQSRTQVGVGQGAGLSNYTLGQMSGTENVALTTNNIPPHVHNGNISIALQADNTSGDQTDPGFNFPSVSPNGYATSAASGVFMQKPASPQTVIGMTGGNQPLNILSPYLAVNYIICTAGIFPSRN